MSWSLIESIDSSKQTSPKKKKGKEKKETISSSSRNSQKDDEIAERCWRQCNTSNVVKFPNNHIPGTLTKRHGLEAQGDTT